MKIKTKGRRRKVISQYLYACVRGVSEKGGSRRFFHETSVHQQDSYSVIKGCDKRKRWGTTIVVIIMLVRATRSVKSASYFFLFSRRRRINIESDFYILHCKLNVRITDERGLRSKLYPIHTRDAVTHIYYINIYILHTENECTYRSGKQNHPLDGGLTLSGGESIVVEQGQSAS
ncbi:hypothetical protein AGLY_011292 [Aphis glycines]|uniref:Uncharacterized protein n=1 Tax=Aphis glycines TaxID=307491 RepID=A0A6G0TD03_APHGL|nr:hypothetical protein AGLY_011292 [Aphis glycines]